jgi:hypothetical protein
MARKPKSPEQLRKEAIETARIVEDAMRSISSRMADLFGEASNKARDITDDLVKEVERGTRGLLSNAEAIADANEKAAEGMYKQRDVAKEIAKKKKAIFIIETKIAEATANGATNTAEMVKELEKAKKISGDFEENLQGAADRSKKVSKAMGLTGAALGGLKKVASTLGLQGIDDIFADASKSASDMAKKVTNSGQEAAGLGGKMKVAFAGAQTAAEGIGKALMDPLFIIGMIVKSIKFLAGIFDHVLKVTNKIGQSVGIAGQNAKNLKKQIHAVGDLSGDIFYNTKELAGAYTTLNKSVGTNLKFNEANAKTFQDLTLYMGVSEEGAAQLFRISTQTGKSYQGMYDQVRDITQSLNDQGTFSMSTQDAIEAIAQSSGTVRFNIKGGTEGLVKAAHTAARLGMTMDEIAAAAATHLDFENSIAKEIEAEMFLQKDLNLDKLRYAALTGDTAMAAAEEERLIRENYKSLKGNVLAQQAFADATGISMDKLGGAMEKQEELSNLTGQELKDKLASNKAMKIQGQEAAAFDRTMQNLVLQMKAMLEPLANVVGPFLQGVATSLGPLLKATASFAKSPMGKLLLGLAGVAVGIKVVSSVIGKIKSFFGFGGIQKDTYTMDGRLRVSGDGGGGGDLLSSVMGRRGIIGGKFFKGLSKVFGGKKSMIGRTLRNFSAMNFKRSSMLNQVVAKGPAWLQKIPGLGKMGTLNSKMAPGVAKTAGFMSKVPGGLAKTLKFLGPIAAAADLAIGGWTGANQANMSAEEQKATGVEVGISKTKATTLGVLTGGAEKGSMFSGALGIEKGGAGDEALGVAGSAGRGALIGATIGSFILPGIGTAIGAGIGGIVGGVSEGFKIFSDPNSSLRQGLDSFVSSTSEKLSEWGTSAKESIVGFAKNTGKAVTSLASGAVDMASEAANYVKESSLGKAVTSVGSSISSGVSNTLSAVGSFFGFADGGIVNQPIKGIVGEAGPEAIIPLDQADGVLGTSEITSLLKELISEVRKGGNVYLDGNKVGYTLALQSSQMG